MRVPRAPATGAVATSAATEERGRREAAERYNLKITLALHAAGG
jgi:hypothetical protein